MNIKNKRYMRNAEFKARQIWLEFTDAVGIVLEIMSDIKEDAANWYKAWVKEFRTPKTFKEQKQIEINFLNWLNIKKTTNHAG